MPCPQLTKRPKTEGVEGEGRRSKVFLPTLHLLVSAPSATSNPVPAAQALRGLQKSQSGSGMHPSSPDREKQRILPPSTLVQGYLRDCLSGRHRQMSQGGSSASSQAKSKGARPKDQGGVGHSGGNQSSSHHKRTNQGQGSSSSSGSPRPTPSATVTSGALAANTSGQGSGGATGHSGQGKRQPGEPDSSADQR